MKKMKLPVLLVLAAVLLAGLIALTGFYRVGQGEEALELTFGKVTGKHGPGLYWHMPGIQSVISESVTTIHTKEYGFRTTRQGSAGRAATYMDEEDEGVMLTSDNSIVSLEAIYTYSIRDVEQYTFDVDQPEETLQLAFEAVIRRNIQNRTLDDALLNKEQIEIEVLPDFQNLIDSYDMGVKILSVRIQNITVPEAVASAYEDVNNAMNEKTKRLDEAERYKNSVLPSARSNAYLLVSEAEAYRAETVAAAQADVAVFNAIYEEYKTNPDIMRTRLMIETLEEVLASPAQLYIVDGQTTRLLTLNDATQAEAAAAAGGDK
ncbi:MAG: FtsH protease activity modulator HflK [Clostridia bacterium]|nr:FtsH protease activity modulator HflK [Clostridia bacterium]